jgi:murein DD-endopeptidase MepM/ murein hydrolase activator NlpD
MGFWGDVKKSIDVYASPKKTSVFQFAKYKGIEIPFSDELKKEYGWTFRSGFGIRYIDGAEEFHKGVDFGVEKGTEVYSLHDGIVILNSLHTNYGEHILVDDVKLLYNIKFLYAHLSKFNVTNGQKVNSGDLIGFSGNTGRSKGPHLHWEKHIFGLPIDPLK